MPQVSVSKSASLGQSMNRSCKDLVLGSWAALTSDAWDEHDRDAGWCGNHPRKTRKGKNEIVPQSSVARCGVHAKRKTRMGKNIKHSVKHLTEPADTTLETPAWAKPNCGGTQSRPAHRRPQGQAEREFYRAQGLVCWPGGMRFPSIRDLLEPALLDGRRED